MKNVSLIAFYGDKPSQLTALIQKLQTYLNNHHSIKDKFIPYELSQVHGTIIGCEGIETNSGIINHWFNKCRQEKRYIDFAGLTYYLHHQLNLPLTIQFGGYDRHIDYNFLSRNHHPYVRSFQLQQAANQTIPVLIGWSWSKEQISLEIDHLRRDFQQFNLLHKYHAIQEAIDNDFYLRLGTINATLTPEAIQIISSEIRDLLEIRFIEKIALGKENLAFAQYQDLSLDPATTQIIPVSEITTNELEQLYL